jgi:hypothetical protein
VEFAHETQKMWEQVVTTAFPLLERRCRQETMLQQSSRSLIDSGGGWIGARRYPMKDLKAGKKLLIPFLLLFAESKKIAENCFAQLTQN